MIRVPLSDEGDFLLIVGRPGPSESEVGGWVLPVEVDATTGDGGWVLPFTVDEHHADPPHVDVTILMMDSEPALATHGFTKVVDVSIEAPAALVEGDLDVTASESGAYRLRFSLDDSNRPPRLVVHSWPSPVMPARLVFGEVEPEPTIDPLELGLPERAPGLAAAARIGNDIDGGPGARALSGRLGIARAHRTLPRTPKWHADFFDQVHVLTRDRHGHVVEYASTPWDRRNPDSPQWQFCAMPDPDFPDQITGWTAAIATLAHSLDNPPHQSVQRWKWIRRTPPSSPHMDWWDGVSNEPVLTQETVRVARFSWNPADKTTTIEIEHRDVPEEWVDDLVDWWSLQLAVHALRT
jgi:hypothetical protein